MTTVEEAAFRAIIEVLNQTQAELKNAREFGRQEFLPRYDSSNTWHQELIRKHPWLMKKDG